MTKYIGAQPATSFEAVKKDRFTGLTGTGVTLSHSVNSVQDVVIWVNNVKQDYNNYTVSGTALTLGGSLVSADVVQVLYVGRTFQTVNPSAASVGNNEVAATIITGQTALGATPADTDELLISDAGTLKRVDYSNIKSANTAVFFASKTSGSQSVSHNTWTKVTFDSETFDDDNVFGSNKFTAPSAGKYFFTVQVCVQQGSVLLKTLLNGFYKNGSSIQDQREFETRTDSPLYEYTLNKSIILALSASDYIEFYIKPQTTDSSATNIRSGSATNLMTFFQGYKLIG